MPFLGLKKPFKVFVIDADTGQPLDPKVKKKSFVKYYEVQKKGDGKKDLIAHKGQLRRGQLDESGVKKEPVSSTNDGKNGNNQSSVDFTPEEDAKLKELKAAKQSWKSIAAEMDKAPVILKKRWKEIEPTEDSAADNGNRHQNKDGKDQDKPNEIQREGRVKTRKGDEPDWKNMTSFEKRREGEKRKAAKNVGKEGGRNVSGPADEGEKGKSSGRSLREKARSVRSIRAPKSSREGSEARFTMQEWLTLQQDDMFSFDELRLLAELLTKSPDSTWDRVAARFFDKTGRRVHPMDIRDKFDEISKMQ